VALTELSTETKNVLQQYRAEAQERRAVRAKVWRCYKDGILKEGLVPEASKQRCSERFGYSLVQVNNVLARRVDLMPETVVDMDATIRVFVDRGKHGVEEAWEELDERLHELDILEGAGKSLVTFEVEETTGDKSFLKKKKQPIHEARLKLLERKLEVAGRFMDRLSSIAGKDAMAAAIGRSHIHVHLDADDDFKYEFNRIRGMKNEKVVVDADAVVVNGDSGVGG
jgi:hypothetical protein